MKKLVREGNRGPSSLFLSVSPEKHVNHANENTTLNELHFGNPSGHRLQ